MTEQLPPDVPSGIPASDGYRLVTNDEWESLLARVAALEQSEISSEVDVVNQAGEVQRTVETRHRGTRLPVDWVPSPRVRDDLRLQYPKLNLNEILIQFVDYWVAVPGSRGLKLDWDRTFRNRVREVAHLPRFQLRQQGTVADKVAGWLELETDAESQ